MTKSTQVTDKLKERLGVATNDEIIPAIERLLEPQQIQAPVTVTLTFVAGHVLSSVSGVSEPPTAAQVGLIQAICRRHADGLERQRLELIEAEIRAQVKRESDNVS